MLRNIEGHYKILYGLLSSIKNYPLLILTLLPIVKAITFVDYPFKIDEFDLYLKK
jgi:hypothetical protein